MQNTMVPAQQPRGMNREQTRALVASKPKAMELMAANLNVEPMKLLDTLKATVFKNASNEELLALVVVSNTYNLNPLLKELYAFPAKGGGIVPVVSVDGWLKMVNRHPDFDGVDFETIDSEDGTPFSITCTLHIKGRSRPVRITEYYSECFRSTEPWKQMPRRMLRHKAMIQAGRVAFGFSGVHDEDEAIDISATIVSEPPAPANVSQLPPPIVQAKSTATASAKEKVETMLTREGFTFDQLLAWMEKEEWITDRTVIGEIVDLDADTVKRLARAEMGVVNGLKAMFQQGAAQ